MKKILSFWLISIPVFLFGQTATITGKITEKGTNEPLIGAVIKIPGTSTGAISDADGNYKLRIDFEGKTELSIEFVYSGYATRTSKITPDKTLVNMELELTTLMGKEVVISGSRVSETLMESPISIEKMTSAEIKSAPSGDFYQGGVDSPGHLLDRRELLQQKIFFEGGRLF